MANKEKFNPYNHSKYPKIFAEGFEEEGLQYWKEIESELLENLKPNYINIDRFLSITKRINRFLINYVPGTDRREMILTLAAKCLFEMDNPINIKLNLISMLISAFPIRNYKLRMNWRGVYHFLN
jgi:hypothetical protein